MSARARGHLRDLGRGGEQLVVQARRRTGLVAARGGRRDGGQGRGLGVLVALTQQGAAARASGLGGILILEGVRGLGALRRQLGRRLGEGSRLLDRGLFLGGGVGGSVLLGSDRGNRGGQRLVVAEDHGAARGRRVRGGIGGCATDRGDFSLGGCFLGGLILAGGGLGLVAGLVGRVVVSLAQGGGRLRGRHHGGERGLRILGHVLGRLVCGVLVCGGEQGGKGILGVFRLVLGGFGLLALLVRRGGGGLIGSGVLCGGLLLGRFLNGSLMRGLFGGLGLLGCLCGPSVGLGGLIVSLIGGRSVGGGLLLGLLLLGGGLGLVGGRNDRKIALGGRHDGQLARRDLVLDRRLERRRGRHAARQAADRDCLDFARVDGLAGLADDRRRV